MKNSTPLFLLILCSLCVFGAKAQEIVSFSLVNAQGGGEIEILTDGTTVNTAALAVDQFSIRANTSGDVGSLVFSLDDETVQTENRAPYALLGNSGSNYTPWIPELGTYRIAGTAYASPNGEGAALDTESITVTFTDEVANEDPTGPAVTSLVLINADTDQDIGEISTGSVFDLNSIGTVNLNIRAETGPDTESIIFGYQGDANYHTENLPVYAIGGNSNEDYKPWTADLGVNTLTATAYTEDRGSGTAGEPYTVTFEIIESGDEDENKDELPPVVRINSGGESITFGDITFEADDFFAGDGKSYINNSITDILETEQDAIYTSERSTNANLQSFSYNFPVTDGEYEIRLHFAEIYFGATGGGSGGEGKRVFDVAIEGNGVIADFDINAEKAPMTAIVKTFTADVSDGELNIVFEASVNQPKVSAIEVFGEGGLVSQPDDDCAWEERADSSLGKVEAQSVKINDKLYVLAGFLSGLKITPTTEIYDPSADSWSSGAPMPTAVTHMGAVGVGEEIWILAGFAGNHPGVATDKVQIYNTITDSWSVGPPLPNPRGSGAAAYSDGKIHFFGGLLPDRRTDVGEHFVLDVNNRDAGWQEAASLPDPRNHLSAAALNGKIYAIGGQFGHDGGVQDQDFLDEYDPTSDSWTRKADLPSARSHFEPGTIVHNDKIIIVGGRRGGFFFDDVTEYDPASDSWSERCELPTTLLAPSAKVFGNRLIVANGGEGGTCCPLKTTLSLPIEPDTTSDPGPDTDDDISVLIYHETNGFRHGSIASGIDMIEELGGDSDWMVDASQASNVFTVANLENYDVVVWLNTSGNGLLTDSEQAAFENFIRNGGGFVGVHAATDTYRDRSWPWYNDLVGGIVQTQPNHTPNNTNATMDVVGQHPATEHLNDTWNKSEEYYYWERNGGYLFDGNIDLLNVRSTGSNSYDAPRPTTWYKSFDGGRSFYTALGHNNSDYRSDNNFRTMMREAIVWAAQEAQAVAAKAILFDNEVVPVDTGLVVYPNPATDKLYLADQKFDDSGASRAMLLDMNGRVLLQKTVNANDHQLEVGGLSPGYYLLSVSDGEVEERQMVFIK